MSEEPKHLHVPWLETWVDGTTIQTSFSGRDGPDLIASGFTWQFFEKCLSLLRKLIRASRESSKVINKKETNLLNECLIDLFLWGEGFSGGRLDKCIERSDSLKSAILGFIGAIAKVVVNDLVPNFKPCISWGEISDASGELQTLIEKGCTILREDLNDSEEDDYNSDYESVQLKQGPKLPVSTNTVHVDIKKIRSNVFYLMKLAPSMEHTLTLDENQEVSSSPIEFQVSDAARSYVYNVHDKYRSAETRLVSRLGEANFQRHVAIRQKMAANNGTTNIDTRDSLTYVPVSAFVPTSAFHDSGLGTVSAASIASHSSFQTDCTQSGKRNFRVPPAPVDTYGNPFMCLICGHTLNNIKSRYDWKIHVFSDLQPYICTFSDCTDALRTFPTRKMWSDHEFSQHRVNVTWICPVCGDEHKNTKDWEEHMDKVHPGSLSKVERHYALAGARRTIEQPIKEQKCPLCLKIAGSSLKTFTAHVCRHLESISLAALPNDATSDSEEGSVSSIQGFREARLESTEQLGENAAFEDITTDDIESPLFFLVRKKIEYYFTDENLSKDFYLRKHMNGQGFVSLKVIENLSFIQHLTQDYELIYAACKKSEVLSLITYDDGTSWVRRNQDRDQWVLPVEDRDESVKNEDLTQIVPQVSSLHDPAVDMLFQAKNDTQKELLAMNTSSANLSDDDSGQNSPSTPTMHVNFAKDANSPPTLDSKSGPSIIPHSSIPAPTTMEHENLYPEYEKSPIAKRISRAKMGVRNYKCEVCRPIKTFTRAEHLRRHQLSHQRPAYPCTFKDCERAFHRPDLLARHLHRHETQAEPPYISTGIPRPNEAPAHTVTQNLPNSGEDLNRAAPRHSTYEELPKVNYNDPIPLPLLGIPTEMPISYPSLEKDDFSVSNQTESFPESNYNDPVPLPLLGIPTEMPVSYDQSLSIEEDSPWVSSRKPSV